MKHARSPRRTFVLLVLGVASSLGGVLVSGTRTVRAATPALERAAIDGPAAGRTELSASSATDATCPQIDAVRATVLDERTALAAMVEPVLRGRVVDRDGRPVPDRWLVALPAVVDLEVARDEHLALDGRTDEHGRFRIVASPGVRYDVHVREEHDEALPDLACVSTEPLVADGRRHTLVLARTPLRLRFSEPAILLGGLDEPGDAVAAAPYSCGSLTFYPDEPTVLLERADVAGDRSVFVGVLDERGDLLFDLPGDRTYRASLVGGDLVPTTALVHVPTVGAAELLLPVTHAADRGRLLVRPHVGDALDHEDAWVTVVLAGTSLALIHDQRPTDEPYELPPGRYEVWVEDGALESGLYPPKAWRPALRGFEELVEVVAHRTTVVDARLTSGARLCVRVSGDVEGAACPLACRVRRVDRPRSVPAPFGEHERFDYGHWYPSRDLPAGSYEVALGSWSEHGFRALTRRTVDVGVGRPVEVEFSLP